MATAQSFKGYNDLANCIRILSADAVEKAGSGHPGMPLGMADVMTVLATRHLRFNPEDAGWFNRDRFVLSAGHGSMLLYSYLYLCGYEGISLDDIKSFRQLGSICAGHPEYSTHPAIETTTGPLGQGVANAVGMAIAEKKYKAELGKEIADYNIYAVVGDGCLMEGISYEAMSLAGHLRLDNLIVIFDDNEISIDGSTSLTTSDDHLKKYEAMGYFMQSVDGHDYAAIDSAIENAKMSDKPSFIACRTVIGMGADKKAGSAKSHGAPLGGDEINYLKEGFGFPEEPFAIPDHLLKEWREYGKRTQDEYAVWQKMFDNLADSEKEYTRAQKLVMPEMPAAKEVEATRSCSGRIIEEMIPLNDKLICGSADLAGSNNVLTSGARPITPLDFSGNFIYFGVRENAMAAICNGLALSGFNPICATFFVFTDYMRPSIRLSALMKLPVTYVMTHDSIGVGEDGPTHQPVEHLASLRAMPGINLYRPADMAETYASYVSVSENIDRPSMLVLSRQGLRSVASNDTARIDGYILSDASDVSSIDYTIFASGSEMNVALEAKHLLEKKGKSCRVVSVVCLENLIAAGEDKITELCGSAEQLVAIEAASSFGWHLIIGKDGRFFGMDSFGESAPGKVLFEHFGLTGERIAKVL